MGTAPAVRYLATLQRVEVMTTREAEASLREQETPVSPAWLDFHDRYAGYIEPIGQDIAIWGLMSLRSSKPGRSPSIISCHRIKRSGTSSAPTSIRLISTSWARR